MRKLLATFLVVALAFGGLPLLAASTPAHASWDWCWDDPIISVNGHIVNIEIGAQANPDDVTAYVVIQAPRGAKLLASGGQFKEHVVLQTNHGRHNDGEVSVSVIVPSRTRFAVQVRISVDGRVVTTVAGTSNQRIEAEIELGSGS